MIQARYGWTDPQLYAIPAARFLRIVDIVQASLIREAKDKMIVEAFGSWQVIEAIKGLFGGKQSKGQKFNDYLKGMKLDDKPPKTPKNKEATKAKAAAALLIAENIRSLDQQLQKGDQ